LKYDFEILFIISDIDECEQLDCEYGCQNTAGSAHCTCPVGYHLLPGNLNCIGK